MSTALIIYGVGSLASVGVFVKVKKRLMLSKAKHPSLRGHSRMSQRFARLVPYYEFDETNIFRADGAPAAIQQSRATGFARLQTLFAERCPQSIASTEALKPAISDMQFTAAYRVPYPFSRFVRERLKVGGVLQAASGVKVTDLDGNEFYDLTGSYGVNVFGTDFYRDCIEAAVQAARELGPVLGAYHPVVANNVARLKDISGLDEVSFHMSGTEAVMQAVRLARYHTKRAKLVRFCGAYHGWWGDVQPGVGNPQRMHDTYTLKDMDDDSLRVLRSRKDIACVLINPLQGLHPNANAPGDSTLMASDRGGHYDKQAYTAWLKQVREVCTARGIVLIFDEVFMGFRLAWGGAQEYFGVKADMVTYGKTLGGGLPVGVVCGRADLMKRFRAERPADICFARGTFNAHPYVMTAMNEFLTRAGTEQMRATTYNGLDARWDGRAAQLNERLRQANVPVEVANLASIFTVKYTKPCRYNWMLQYYLRAQGLALSWVGTGRLIFSHNYTDEDFEAVVQRFVAAATSMKEDGFWWARDGATNKDIKRGVLREMLAAWRGNSPV